MTDRSEQVEQHFHRTSKGFDSYYKDKKGVFSKLIDETFRRSMRMRYEKVIGSIAPYEGKTVLDVGCGAGRYCIALADKGIKKALGVDFAENMIEEAKLLSRAFEMTEICEFERRDFMDMDTEQRFHHVIAMGVLDYVEDAVSFVKKMVETATDSVMVSFPTTKGVIQKFRRFKFEKINKCPIHFYTVEDVERIAREAGGERIIVDKMAKDLFLTIKK